MHHMYAYLPIYNDEHCFHDITILIDWVLCTKLLTYAFLCGCLGVIYEADCSLLIQETLPVDRGGKQENPEDSFCM